MNPFTVHPVEIAGQIAALDAASYGRAYLGLVRGAWLDELRISQSRPVVALREAWEVIRRLLSGDLEGFSGERFSLPPGRELHYELVRPAVPLLIGAWRAGLAALAGELAGGAQGRRVRKPGDGGRRARAACGRGGACRSPRG